jgi:hypothetical protein
VTTRANAATPTCPTCLAPPTRYSRANTGNKQDQLQITYVSHLAEDGADPLFLQQQAGHSWASTTAIYTHVGADAKNRMLQQALRIAFDAEEDWS